MCPATTIEFLLPDEDATRSLAEHIAPALTEGDVLLLSGPIGAGKSHFARSVIQARLSAVGIVEDVPSPTYTLVQTYEAGGLEIWHCDLYRLASITEVDELGLTDAFTTAACLIEWPDRLGSDVPASAHSLEFRSEAESDARRLTVFLPGEPKPSPLTRAFQEATDA